jgi:hypothetical protein
VKSLVYISIDLRKELLREPTTDLAAHRASVKSPGGYVSIGLRRESLRELTANLDFSPYEWQPMIMLVSMQNEGSVKHTMAMRRE